MRAKKLASLCIVYFGTIAFLLTGCAKNIPTGQNTKAGPSAFSFAVFGDSRTMMYLPHRADQKADAVNYMEDMFELVLPEKVAKEVWVWWGKQGAKPSENPYWNRVNEELVKQLPAPDDHLREAGLDGRVFPAAGNHEVWEDPNAEGFLSTFSYLKKFGVSDKQLIYKFDYNGVRFIFLWTGQYDYREPTGWVATRPSYEAQMNQLRQWLEEAKGAGTKKVFISFHNPVFCRSGMGAIPEAQNPHKLLASYAKDLDIVVFNGHVHTTEVYDVDGVKYLLLGGGGAEQDPILPGRTHIKVPENYPPDRYWQGAAPKEEYNYLLVDVKPGEKTKFTLSRFRPWAAKPFESVELYK